jgi:hypothetical protein
LHARGSIDQWIKSASDNAFDLNAFEAESLLGNISPDTRAILAKASKQKNNPWFKNVASMEYIGRNIVGPEWQNSQQWFRQVLAAIFSWINNA